MAVQGRHGGPDDSAANFGAGATSPELEFVTEVVAALDPEQVPYVAALWDDPRYSQPNRRKEHALGSNLVLVGGALAPLVVALLSKALEPPVEELAQRGWRRLFDWWRRLRRRPAPRRMPRTRTEADRVIVAVEAELQPLDIPEDGRLCLILTIRKALDKRLPGGDVSSTETDGEG